MNRVENGLVEDPAASKADQMVALIREATGEDLTQLDRRIESLRAEADSLAQVRKLMATRLLGKTPRTKKAGEPGMVKGELTLARRRAVVDFLTDSGPESPSRIAKECDIPMGSMSALLDSPWFSKGPNGYVLTPLGNREGRES